MYGVGIAFTLENIVRCLHITILAGRLTTDNDPL